MTLSEAGINDIFTILSIPDSDIRAQAIRFGLFEGAKAKCVFKIDGGPVLLSVGGQEIAVGNPLAKKIEVSPAKTNKG